MLIDFRTLFPKFGIKPNGVLHIGGNVGEEFPVYMGMGILKQIWFEPNPKMYDQLMKNISANPYAIAYPYAVGDEDKEVVLHESNNAGQSSSILELGTHKEVHPEVHYISDINCQMKRLDTFFKPGGIQTECDFLNIDIQGAELLALKGMGEMLHQFKWAYLEVNKAPLYVGCALVEEIDEYLKTFGFERVETLWAGNTNWGDALYVKKEFVTMESEQPTIKNEIAPVAVVNEPPQKRVYIPSDMVIKEIMLQKGFTREDAIVFLGGAEGIKEKQIEDAKNLLTSYGYEIIDPKKEG